MQILKLENGYVIFIETEEVDPSNKAENYVSVSAFAEGKFPGYPACDRKKCKTANELAKFIALYSE